VFLMEAIWSRCLPSYAAIEREIREGSIGDVTNVFVSFGKYIEAARLHTKELGGGTVLDLGVYCVQLASLAMGKVSPDKVIAGGHLGPGGVDESTSSTVLYSGNRTATLVTSSRVDLPDEAFIVGTKGTIKVCYPMWTPTEIETPGGKQSWVLPTGNIHPFNYGNGGNMSYEAQHVRDCLLAGKLESPLISLDETLIIAQIMQDIRTQAGVVYPQDE
jgi:dihydrodiol dehydrogenase / D-xylose 1-dehydrogenase (NADP)